MKFKKYANSLVGIYFSLISSLVFATVPAALEETTPPPPEGAFTVSQIPSITSEKPPTNPTPAISATPTTSITPPNPIQNSKPQPNTATPAKPAPEKFTY